MKEDYEFEILYDIVDEVIENGEVLFKVLRKDCKRRWYVPDIAYNITDIREVPTRTGKPYKTRCEVFSRIECKWILVKGNYNKLKELLKQERVIVKGFKKWK